MTCNIINKEKHFKGLCCKRKRSNGIIYIILTHVKYNMQYILKRENYKVKIVGFLLVISKILIYANNSKSPALSCLSCLL